MNRLLTPSLLLLVSCYASHSISDGAATGDASLDPPFADTSIDAQNNGLDGSSPYVTAPLVNTLWVIHDNVLEERRLDDLSLVAEPVELDFPPGFVNVSIAATENGCLLRVGPEIRVYDRRAGMSAYLVPSDHGRPGTRSTAIIIRDGWWLMPYGPHTQDQRGVRLYRGRRFHIETGRFELYDFLPPLYDELGERENVRLTDGLDGRLVGIEGPTSIRTFRYVDGAFEVDLETDPGDTRLRFNSRIAPAMRDGALVAFDMTFGSNWTIWQRNEGMPYSLRRRRDGWETIHQGIVVTAADEFVFLTRRLNGLNEVVFRIHKTNAQLEDAIVMLGPVAWEGPIRIALGDPTQRVANSPL